MNAEEQNTEIRNKLLNLPKIKAGADFENKLLRKINSLNTEEKQPERAKRSLFEMIFGRKAIAWAVPAGSIAVILIIYFSFFNNNSVFIKDKTPENTTSVTTETKSSDTKTPVTKNNIPGKDIANDLEIGKNPESNTEKTIQKGYTETNPNPRPHKTEIEPEKTKVEDKNLKEESKTYDTRKTEMPVEKEMREVSPLKPTDKKITDEAKARSEEDAVKREEKTDVKKDKNAGNEKNVVSPMIKNSEKKQSDKSKTGKDSTKKSEDQKGKKELSKELLEELRKKIKDN